MVLGLKKPVKIKMVTDFAMDGFTKQPPLFIIFLAPHGHNYPDGCCRLVTFCWVIYVEIKRMRDLREDKDRTQQEIADVLNMHRSVYRRYESGERETPAWVVVKLADYYQVSTDYLLGRTDDPTPPKGT